MPSISREAAERPAPRPYGIIGLVVSSVAILAATVVFCLLAAAVVFGAACAILGWRHTVDYIIDLDPSGGVDLAFREKLAVLVSPVIYAALSLAVLLAARVRGGGRWRDLVAWKPWHPLRGARLVWAIAVLTLLYSFGAEAAITHVSPHFQNLVHMPKGIKWVALFILLAAVVAPIAEELLFRGWLYTSLRASFGVPAAIVSSALLFALAHWEKTHLYALAVFPVGLALAFIRERTGSIKASMSVHGFYNGVASLLLLFAR